MDVLTNGAVFTKTYGGAEAIVSIELDGDTGLFYAAKHGNGPLDTDRAEFDSKEDRDEALLNVVAEYTAAGYVLAD